MIKPTRGPWKAKLVDLGSRGRKWFVVSDRGRASRRIASVVTSAAGGGSPINEANARFIVRACNAHDDLLIACEAAMEIFRDLDLGHLAAFDLLDKAIDKVTESNPR